MLVGAAAGIDDIVIGLETLIGAHVPEQAIMFFDKRDDFLAGERGDGANDMPAAMVAQHGARTFEIGGDIGMRVDGHGLDGIAMEGTDFLDRKIGAVTRVASDLGIGAGRRIQNANSYRVFHQPAKNQKPHDAVPI